MMDLNKFIKNLSKEQKEESLILDKFSTDDEFQDMILVFYLQNYT